MKLLTPSQVAELMQVSVRTVIRHSRRLGGVLSCWNPGTTLPGGRYRAGVPGDWVHLPHAGAVEAGREKSRASWAVKKLSPQGKLGAGEADRS